MRSRQRQSSCLLRFFPCPLRFVLAHFHFWRNIGRNLFSSLCCLAYTFLFLFPVNVPCQRSNDVDVSKSEAQSDCYLLPLARATLFSAVLRLPSSRGLDACNPHRKKLCADTEKSSFLSQNDNLLPHFANPAPASCLPVF